MNRRSQSRGGRIELDGLSLLAIPGSLRKRSLNRSLLTEAASLAPSGVAISVEDLTGIPLYNQDVDNDSDRPKAVEQFKSKIASADGLLIATPEYNGAVPGVLKNALDWASRPSFRSPLASKPVAILGASPGSLGTARAQEFLKIHLMATLAEVFPHRGVAIGRAAEKFDADGRLVDERTRDYLAAFLQEFSDWITSRFVREDVARAWRPSFADTA